MTQAPLAPIVLFAYNRPRHLQQTLDALAACRLAERSVLHVYADGPRNPAAAEAVAQVRTVLEGERQRGRFAQIHLHASTANKGLARSIIHGVGEVIARHGSVIVLEDDMLLAADFLEIMNDCLQFYRDDPTVGAISGFSPLKQVPGMPAEGVYLSGRSSSQGWGTWSRVWNAVDWQARGAQALARNWKLRRAFNAWGNDRYDRLRRQLAGRIDSWSIRFGLSLFERALGVVYPVGNRVVNIGFDGSGVHCGDGTAVNDAFGEAPYRLAPLQYAPQIRRAFHRIYSGGLRGRVLREVLAAWPRLAGWLGR